MITFFHEYWILKNVHSPLKRPIFSWFFNFKNVNSPLTRSISHGRGARAASVCLPRGCSSLEDRALQESICMANRYDSIIFYCAEYYSERKKLECARKNYFYLACGRFSDKRSFFNDEKYFILGKSNLCSEKTHFDNCRCWKNYKIQDLFLLWKKCFSNTCF